MAERFDVEQWLHDARRHDLFLFGHDFHGETVHDHVGYEPEIKLQHLVYDRESACSVEFLHDLDRPNRCAALDFGGCSTGRL